MGGTTVAESATGLESRDAGNRNRRITIAYGVFLGALIPFFLWAGRREWFQRDDWDYLVRRKAGDLGDLFRPHNGHWETIPVVAYRMLWSMFGLRYRPFELLSILLSLAGAALLLTVMLRARTRPWIAIALTTLLVFFGDAQANVALRVTSITFVGFAVPLGLLQLLAADHEGPLSRRDRLGLAAGLASVLCSSVAIAMLFVVGIVVLVKRGWRIALFHVLPPGIAFSVWYATLGHKDDVAGNPAHLRPIPSALHFASVLLTGTFESLTRTSGIGVVLVAFLVIGLFLALRHAGPEVRQRAVVPLAMLLGALLFAIETGLGRADLLHLGAQAVRAGHYMDVVAYLVLPALALVFEELVRRRRVIAPVLVAMFVLLIPLNARALVSSAHDAGPELRVLRNAVLLMPRLPLAKEVPRTLQPFNGVASPITVGWLLDSAREGRLPKLAHATAANKAVATLRLSLVVTASKATRCGPFPREVARRLGSGGSVRFRGAGVRVAYVIGGRAIATVPYATAPGPVEWQIVNVGRPLSLRILARPVAAPKPLLCN